MEFNSGFKGLNRTDGFLSAPHYSVVLPLCINIVIITVGLLLVRCVSASRSHLQVILVRNGDLVSVVYARVSDLAYELDCVTCLVTIFLISCLFLALCDCCAKN